MFVGLKRQKFCCIWPIFIVLLAVGLAGCRQSAGGIPLNSAEDDAAPELQLIVETGAERQVMGPVTWRIKLLNNDGQPVDDAQVVVRGDMNHAGMVPVEAAAEYTGDGYSAEFEWTMAGDWIVTVTATLADGRVKTAIYEYAVATR